MKKNLIFACILILLLSSMIFYNVQSKDAVSMDAVSFERNVNLMEDAKRWMNEKESIVIGYDVDAYPLAMQDGFGNSYGFFQDYLNVIGDEVDVKICMIDVTGMDFEEILETGLVDGIIIITSSKLRSNQNVTAPLIPVKGIVVVSTESEVQKNVVETGRGIAVKGSIAQIELEDSKNKEDHLYVSDLQAGLAALETGAGDFLVSNEHALRQYLRENNLYERFKILYGYFYEENYCILTNDESTPLYTVLNSYIYQMNNAKVLSELQGYWFGSSYSIYQEQPFKRGSMLFIIIMTAILCTLYLFYAFNRGIYKELSNRTEVLMSSKREFEATFDGVPYDIAEVNGTYEILSINRAFAQKLQISKREAEGHHIQEFLDVTPNKKEEDDLATLIAKTFKEEVRKSGDFYAGRNIYNIHTFPIEDSKGLVQKVLIMVLDVTRERSAERQMLQDNKMIAVGQLAFGVAHEIRNPLGVIMNYCYVLKNLDKEDEETKKEAIQIIEKSVKRSGRIIDSLLNFSRTTSEKHERVHLKSYVESLFSLQLNLVKTNVEVDLQCDEDLILNTRTDSLDMILINLVSNAIDAMKDGGKLSVECTREAKDIIIKIADTGIGITPEILEDIFNPFFTTKPRGEGNGLGLYIVYSEVNKLNGQINVSSEQGKGTVFTITLPNEGDDYAETSI